MTLTVHFSSARRVQSVCNEIISSHGAAVTELHTWEASRLMRSPRPVPSEPDTRCSQRCLGSPAGATQGRGQGEGTRAEPRERTPAGTGTFPSALLARSPVLSWPSVPKKHFEIKTQRSSLSPRSSCYRGEGKREEGGRRPRKKSLCQVEPVSLRGKMFWHSRGLKSTERTWKCAWMLQCNTNSLIYRVRIACFSLCFSQLTLILLLFFTTGIKWRRWRKKDLHPSTWRHSPRVGKALMKV